MQPVVFAPGMAGQRGVPSLIRPTAASTPIRAEFRPPAPLDAKERETLIALLSKLR
jgi:hypothetical protein